LAADGNGNVYVADRDVVWKFTSDGGFLSTLGEGGGADGQFDSPSGLAVDASGNMYVADTGNRRVQKFAPNGEFLAKWQSHSGGAGRFHPPQIRERGFDTPLAIAVDSDRNVYVLDKKNYRVQKYSPAGQYLTQWGSRGSGQGQFDWDDSLPPFHFGLPAGIALNNQGVVYVTDRLGLQKFNSEGQFITAWSLSETEDPGSVAVNSKGQVFVVDRGQERVMKYSPTGKLLKKWGPEAQGDEIWWPSGIAVDGRGNVLVSDLWKGLIQRFTGDGRFLGSMGNDCGEGEFTNPAGLAVDLLGNVLLVDHEDHRIYKFESDGRCVCEIGEGGTDTGQLNNPSGVAVDIEGRVYVADTANNRITVFGPVFQPRKIKAIILAGGGPYAENHLWEATQMVSNLAFRSLRYQGFLKDQIRYLTSSTNQDLDGNGEHDDLMLATKDNLEDSVKEWANDAEQLLIYLTDHGEQGTFRINADDEEGILKAEELASWLDELPDTQVVVIIDACFSGSFLEVLSGKGRIVITSTAPEEKAMFGPSGSLSFSNFFWAQIFNGADFHTAFSMAKQVVSILGSQDVNPQTPQLNGDGNANPNELSDDAALANVRLVNKTRSFNRPPVIKSYSATPSPIPAGSNKANLRVDGVTDADGIQRVWAVLWPPNFNKIGRNPITQLPSVNLGRISTQQSSYEATYDGFASQGTYHVLFYAMDRHGNVSSPHLLQLQADNPLRHKAVIVAGGTGREPWFPAVCSNARMAYRTLRAQSYADDDIRVLSRGPMDKDVPVYGEATSATVREAIESWADETQDLVLYLVGTGERGAFSLGQEERLQARDLAISLAGLESKLPGRIIVVYDGCHSGSFVPVLKSQNQKRIVIASARADQSSCLANNGISSFSHFFWLQVLNGLNVWEAFWKAKWLTAEFGKNQVAQLDDNGDGLSNTEMDGNIAQLSYIGPGFSLGSDPPVIKTACPNRTLDQHNSAVIWVEDVSTTGAIEEIWGVVVPPDYQPTSSTTPGTDFQTFELTDPLASGRYQGIYDRFTTPGRYLVTVFAKDREGNVSQPKIIRVNRK
jgi:DNA-binding beta-propeller fold protein YncE